jgi:putative tryptophan/tyrosine transport system substrate-binding protein
MRRRTLLIAFCLGFRAPAGAQTGRAKQVGVLFPGEWGAERLELFMHALAKNGGGNASIIVRNAEGDPNRLREFAREFARTEVDAILAIGSASLRAAFETTRSLPIVALDLETDPVKAGMVASLNRPGGNVTGVFFDAPQIAGKWLQLLRDVLPSINLVGLLYDEHTDHAQMSAAEEAAPTLGVRTVRLPVNAPDDIPRVIERAEESTVGALLIHSSPIFVDRAKVISTAALKQRLPSIGLFPINARTGALLAYGPDNFALLQDAGEIVAKVLAGSKPADLPIVRPSRFKLVVNLTTARELGIRLSPSFLLIADEIIE